MEINKKSRTELKAYFVKNALPTASNFSDLIDAALNQKDDGLVTAADQPVQIAASTAGDKPAIHLYESFATDTKPAWVLGLQAAGTKGLAIGDGDGNSRLFIEGATGNVAIGAADPSGNKLRVAGNVLVDGTDGKAGLSFGSSMRQMVNLWASGVHGIGVQSATVYFRSNTNFAFYKGGVHNDTALEPGKDGTAMLVIKDGNVAIGTNDPAGYKLRVVGNVLVDGTDGKATMNFGSTARQMLNLWSGTHAIGVQNSTVYLRSSMNFAFYKGGVHSDTALDPGKDGTALLLIDSNGNVQVSGGVDVKLGHVAACKEEVVRIVRGEVASDGTIVSGSGFTAKRVSTGLYDITFSTSFNSRPSVVSSQHYSGTNESGSGDTRDNANVTTANSDRARIKTGDGGGAAADRNFCFIAIGT